MRRSLVGQQLGNYHLLSLLGRGGFAEVYLGEHRRLHRQAAIKVLFNYLSERDVAGFQYEAEVIANLDHPHIVRVLDFDVQEGIPFLVMDYYPYGSLRDRHPKGERIPLETVVSYVKQVAEALQYAHDQRLIHRDIKPENMLIGRHNEILLSDFGIVTIAHSTSSMSMQDSAGTFPYMAPEQIQAHPRPASDQYALGVVTYEWLTGERPFEGTIAELIAKHLTMQAPSLRLKLPSLPVEVAHVVSHALTKEPQQRFTTVRAFAVALEQASQTKDILPASGTSPLGEPELRIDESTPAISESRSKPVDTPPAQSYSPTAPASVREEQSVEETAPQTHTHERSLDHDIRTTLAISTAEAINGTSRILKIPGGRQVTAVVPAGISNGQIIRLVGQGEPSLSSEPSGDLILTITVRPKEASPGTMNADIRASTVLGTPPVSNRNKGSRPPRLPGRKVILSIVLILLMILGSGGLLYSIIINQTASNKAIATANTQANSANAPATAQVGSSATPTAATAMATTLAQFNGTWVNDDSGQTKGVSRINITNNSTTINVQAFGKCGTSDCLWGNQSALYTGPQFTVNFTSNTGSAEQLIVSLNNPQQLKVIDLSSTNGSTTYTFHKSQVLH